MNSIILCEGSDDLWMIGYFLHKACNNEWNYISERKIANSFDLPIDSKSLKSELYTNGSDNIAICSVGGKTGFTKIIKEYILKMNSYYGKEGFEQIVIVRDRDDDKIEDILNDLQQCFWGYKNMDFEITSNITLENMQNISIECIKHGTCYTFNIAVIIIPFDCDGSLETVLSKAISTTGKEEKGIHTLSSNYVDEYIEKFGKEKYLARSREEVKSKFSAMLSIINPTSSTKTMDQILMDYDWEKSSYIRENFKLLISIFSK